MTPGRMFSITMSDQPTRRCASSTPPDVVKLLQHAGVEPIGCTPEQSAIALGNENQRFTVPAKAAGLRAD